MPSLQRVRRLISTIVLLYCSVFAASLYAANITTQTQKVDDQPSVERLSFSQDLGILTKGDTITVQFKSLEYFTVTEHVKKKDGSFSIKAKSKNKARMLISANDNAVYGSVTGESLSPSDKSLNYTISTDNQLGIILVNHNHPAFAEIDMSDDAMVPPTMRIGMPGISQMAPSQKAALEQRRSEKLRSKADGESKITMLVIYSREFGQGFSSPTTRINDLLNFTNESLSASDIGINFVLARAQQVDFDNSLSTNTVLTQVTNGTGAFSGIASIRDQVGADMVAVLSFADNFSANGVAWVNGNDPDFAYSATRLSPRCCNSVFAHELGHNLGSGHERTSVNPVSNPCSEFNFTGFSCGHGNASRNWGTIMSRLNSEIVGNVFSNPLSNDCRGEPCGIPEGQTGAADNKRSFNISRLLIENFRDDPEPTMPPPDPPRPNSNSTFIIVPIIGILLDDD